MSLLTEKLSDSLQKASAASGFSEEVSAKIFAKISALVPQDSIGSHYVVVGPLPEFPDTQLDIWILTKKTLYNYMVDKEAVVTWFVLPLAHMTYLSEAESSGGWNILRVYGSSGTPALIIQERESNWDELLRRFIGDLIGSI